MVNVVETVVDFALKQVVGQKKEKFQNNNSAERALRAEYAEWAARAAEAEYQEKKNAILALLMVLVYLIIVLLFGKVLWNSCLCRLLPVKECKSVWHILGLMIFLGLIFPTNTKIN